MPVDATYTPAIGGHLPNGALIIACRLDRNTKPGWIVLAHTGDDYVTWRVSAVDGQAFSGDYFYGDFDGAVASFQER